MNGEFVFGYPVREPSESELEFFKNQMDTPAYAAEDGSIVMNPFVELTAQQQQGIKMNEASRLYMRENKIVPDFDITPEQQESFKGSPYEGNIDAMKQTITGRILSNDKSAGNATPTQKYYTRGIYDQLRRRRP